MREFELFIDGAWRKAKDGRTVPTINPTTEAPWAQVAAASEEDAVEAIEAAHRAFHGPWGSMDREARAEILDAICEGIFDRTEELIDAEISDNGTTFTKASTADIPFAGQCFFHFANLLREQPAEQEFEEEVPVPSRNLVVAEPYGVCSLIVPWNFPLTAACMKAAPALAAGNTVVLKPSPHTPVTALILGEICKQAGLPDGVLNVISAPEDALGEVMVSHPKVSKVSFTGSSRVGRRVMELASQTVKPLTLELGGKSPSILLDDADLDTAIRGILFGTFFHAGQICTSGSRVLVPHALHDEVVERMVAGVKNIRIGDPTDMETTMGPLSSQAHWENVDRYVRLGLEEGAKAATGAGRPEGLDTGYYYEPTIFTGVRNDMRIAQEEIFGPVVCVIPYEDEEQALHIANDTHYGLAGGVWSSSPERALAIARRIESGTVWINDYHLLNVRFPFGGCKQSGFGCELGDWGLGDFTRRKHIHVGEMGSPEEKFYTEMLLGEA